MWINCCLPTGKPVLVGTCSVPGVIINQFAMDEYKDTFRVASSTGNVWEDNPVTASNNLYVYSDKMELLGSVTGLAPRERIYSVRYNGERAYVVTFRQVCMRVKKTSGTAFRSNGCYWQVFFYELRL